jgi:hypothetical protein
MLFKTTVTGVGPFCVEFDDGEIITTRTEARQRLIAAAPELLEALQGLLKLDELECGDESLLEVDHPLIKAQWAVAKAIGKSHPHA